ncbi:aldolase, partial [Hortaea werneckii]
MNKPNGVMKIEEIIHNETPRLLVLHDRGQEDIVRVIADVLGQAYVLVPSLDGAAGQPDNVVIGMDNGKIKKREDLRRKGRTTVTTHCIDALDLRDEDVTSYCDYEYLYTEKPFVRRDVARFLGFVLGQIKPHDDLKKKARTTLLSTTFPDVRTALPNLDILSVGADSVELRVDLLQEPTPDSPMMSVPSIRYVGEQVMLLRQRTELPIIFTTRCTKENGRFPMDDPMLFYQYLRKAVQWGCEYIDVELWLPEEIRQKLAAEKGSSRIISAWHDFSGKFKWSSAEAQQLFREGAVYGDIVKMIALSNTTEENYELEYFRSVIQTSYAHPPLSGLNMGSVGQLSRTLNKVFTPITHPLLPMIAAPGQLSAAEINSTLHSMGQMPKLDMYAIGNVRQNGQAMFFEKCLNELSLPHQLLCIERIAPGAIERFISTPTFGGAHINPPLPASASFLPKLSNAATAVGQVDTVVAHSTPSGKLLMGDNSTWKGIRATLTREFVPSAYAGQAALVLASQESQAAAAMFALMSLNIGPIYTIGFQAKGMAASNVHQFRGLDDMKKMEAPFVIISALPAEKSFIVSPLLKHYSSMVKKRESGKVFVDLSNGVRGKGDSVATATTLGWSAYGIADVNAWTTVETLRLLVGQNVPYDFGSVHETMSYPMQRVAAVQEKLEGSVEESRATPEVAMSAGRLMHAHIRELKPSCEACQVFNVACIYDAIPKKRGPKTDVLEALLKRVNGLEKRLKDEKNPESADADNTTAEGASATQDESHVDASSAVEEDDVQPHGEPEASRADTKQQELQPTKQTTPAKSQTQLQAQPQAQVQAHQHEQEQLQAVQSQAFAEALVDIYFARLHGKPYYILDEPATRQRLRDGQLPRFLNNAIYAVSIRHATHMCGGLGAAIGYSQEHARQARQEIDVDEPSIEHLQALLLLTMATFQSGRGKRSYMLLSHAISMAFALSLHRELPSQLRISPSEREGRRKLFWTCYLMDRFTVSGSKRPTLISDEAICLRLPAWLPAGAHLPVDGNFFPNGSSLPYAAGMSTAGQGIGAMLVEIVRVLGVTNR